MGLVKDHIELDIGGLKIRFEPDKHPSAGQNTVVARIPLVPPTATTLRVKPLGLDQQA